tara:strand:- start:66 stop:434 length:369 start_codon:yes stop_codon:yes gene_type:complete
MKYYNSIVISTVIFLNVINIILFRRRNYLTTAISIGLLCAYYALYNFSEYNDNISAYFIIMLIISFAGPIVETIIIHSTNGEAWIYGYPLPGYKVPLWLLPGYGMLGLACVHAYNFFKNNLT